MCFSETSQALIVVNRLPLVNFEGLNPAYQADDPGVSLVGFPHGGTFTGPGITDTIFSPVLAGTGTHLIRYDYTDINGCSNFVEGVTVVNEVPDVEIGNPGPYCFNEIPTDNPLPRTARTGFVDSWSGENVFEANGEYYFNHTVAGVGSFFD